ncbi:Hypothetical predicted protein [Octopus vulgaris]|uniref:Uncharacterized protein n=1 Tax=Octopus vulgaris TaxID=6645 RepID=A0AA36BPW6_OCTVU|nr:Hypothetical predicted protein [Octopus vulgaris]
MSSNMAEQISSRQNFVVVAIATEDALPNYGRNINLSTGLNDARLHNSLNLADLNKTLTFVDDDSTVLYRRLPFHKSEMIVVLELDLKEHS